MLLNLSSSLELHVLIDSFHWSYVKILNLQMATIGYRIVVQYFDEYEPIVSVDIHPKVDVYEILQPSGKRLASVSQTEFTWNAVDRCSRTVHFRSAESFYKPTENDLPCHIELEIECRLQNGKVVKYKKRNISAVRPQNCLPEWSSRVMDMVEGRNWKKMHNNDIFIYSHNIRAERYIDHGRHKKNYKFNWVFRINYTIQEIKQLRPDVILLQEIQEHILNVTVKKQFPEYEFHFIAKDHGGGANNANSYQREEDGVCIGVKSIYFSSITPVPIDFNTHWTTLTGSSNLDAKVYNKPNVSMVVVVEKRDSKKKIIIGTVHLSAQESRARMYQVSTLFKCIKEIPEYTEETPVIIGGDFNANPNCDIMAGIINGEVRRDTNDEFSELRNILPLDMIRMQSAYRDIFPAAGQNSLLLFKENNEREPYTCRTIVEGGTIVSTKDYIMFSNATCTGALPMFSKKNLKLATLPSDHVAVAAKFLY